jgi:hypothetical protein
VKIRITATALACFTLSLSGLALSFSARADSTANADLSNTNSFWTETTPMTQIELGFGDIIFVTSFASFDDPVFIKAKNKYVEQLRRERITKTVFEESKRSKSPGSAEYEAAWSDEKSRSIKAETELLRVAKERGYQRVPYTLLRKVSEGIFAIDFFSRVAYYYVAQEDPGWFPFVKVLHYLGP